MNETDFYKDDIEKNIGTSFYKYSAIDLGMGCENCSECEKCEQKRRMRLQRKLEGEVYFSSPLDFNDIIDSQLKTHYNMDLESKRSVLKLRELFHKEIEENGIEWIYEYVADFKESKSGDKKK